MPEPAFWGRPPGLVSGLLTPIACIYGLIAGARMARTGSSVGIPVLCIGNLTLGGAGKTPTAIAVAQILTAAGRRPFMLSRGYGGTLAGPVRVEPARHRAIEVGDEPILHARLVPTIVSRDRVAGAKAAVAAGADVVVMDDGFQNPSLAKTLSIVVVDGRRGIGNGAVCPAGPLRAPLERQLRHAHAVLLVGAGPQGEAVAVAARARGLQVFHGRLVPDPQALEAFRGRPVLAFAGIGDPEKFFATLVEAGIEVRARVPFADHHRFHRAEALDLMARAERDGLVLVTTEKDLMRLAGQDDVKALAGVARALPVSLDVDEQAEFRDFVLAALG